MSERLPFSFAKLGSVIKARGRPSPGQMPGQQLFDLAALERDRRVSNENAIRSACKIAYLGQNTALCRVLGRYKAYVDTTDIGLSSHLMIDGYWEMWVTETLVRLVKPGMVVADIGANIGYFSLLMAELVGPGGRVHAFEPNPHLVRLMSKSLTVNGFASRADVHQVALTDQDDRTVTLVVPPTTPMNAYILPLGNSAPPDSVEVPVARLDSRQEWQAIELAKIDVEGAEELIWAGAQGLLDSGKLRTVVLEFNPHRYADPTAFLHRLCGYGFTLNHLTLSDGVIATDMNFILNRPGTEDIMLVLSR